MIVIEYKPDKAIIHYIRMLKCRARIAGGGLEGFNPSPPPPRLVFNPPSYGPEQTP